MGKSSKRSRRKTRRKLNPYNIYMRDEIAAIKERDPKIPHREAFTQASRSWSTSMRNPKNQLSNNQGKIPRNKSKRREIIKEKKAKKQTRKQVMDQKEIQKILNNDKSKKQETIFQDILHMIVNANDDIDELDVEMSETNENEDKNVDNQHQTVITDADVNMTVDDKLDNEAAENDETIGSGVSEGNQAAENETIGSGVSEGNLAENETINLGVSEGNQVAENETINSGLSEENQAVENEETIKPGPMHDVKKIIEKITDIESLKHSDIYKVFEKNVFICDSCKRPYLVRNDHTQ
ncbi:15151_t:CDS:2 [Rhizophagus irregularis]|nr:15151_t:CDS:2 [Rhizophagus irregularis]